MATANTGEKTRESGFNTPAVVLIALAVLIFAYAFALFMQGGFLKAQEMEKEAKVLNQVDPKVKDALAEQNAILQEGYRWIDQEKGTVGMPIDAAKELLVEQAARKESE